MLAIELLMLHGCGKSTEEWKVLSYLGEQWSSQFPQKQQKADNKGININDIKINTIIQKAVITAIKELSKIKFCFVNATQMQFKIESSSD